MPSTTASEPRSMGPVPLVVYVAMFGATVAGQLTGMAADHLALQRRVAWVPVACSVVLEAYVGARLGAARIGRPLAWGECARVSAYYSIGLAAVSLPLVLWTLASKPQLQRGTSSRDIIVILVAFVAATALRQAIMTLLSTARARLWRGWLGRRRNRS